jgi:hypothetical protein
MNWRKSDWKYQEAKNVDNNETSHEKTLKISGEKNKSRNRMMILRLPAIKTWMHNTANIKLGPDSSVGIALGYGLDDRGYRFRFPAGAGNSSLHHLVQNGSGAQPASYPMGTRGSFPGV